MNHRIHSLALFKYYINQHWIQIKSTIELFILVYIPIKKYIGILQFLYHFTYATINIFETPVEQSKLITCNT